MEMTEDINFMDIKEFREQGYLHEVNRRFFHPLGLALAVHIDDEGNEIIGGIWDYRHEVEGIFFGMPDLDKANNIDRIWAQREPGRREALGYMIQPKDDDTSA